MYDLKILRTMNNSWQSVSHLYHLKGETWWCRFWTWPTKAKVTEDVSCRKCWMLTLCGLVTSYGNIDLGQHCQVIACCLTAPSHYLNQCWLNICVALWHSAENDFTRNAQDIYPWYQFENYWFKTSTRGQWVNLRSSHTQDLNLGVPKG